MNLVRWEWALLWRNSASRWVVALYVVACCAAVGFADRQLTMEASSREAVADHWQYQLDQWRQQPEPIDPGYVAYYVFMPTFYDASPWAALIPGERGEQNAQLRVRLLALQGQLYGGENRNFQHLVVGSLDLEFLLIVLMPLVIGLLAVNVRADDDQMGRWRLLASQTAPKRIIGCRLGLRFGVVAAANGFVIVGAGLWLGAPGASTASLLAIALLYQTVWFLVVAVLVNRNWTARVNVLAFIGLWVVFAFVVPALSYISRMDAEHLFDSIAATVQQREAMNNAWDRNQQADFNRFLEAHPEWRETAPLPAAFHWKWYYAMQQASDESVAALTGGVRERRLQQAARAQLWGWVSPVIAAQTAMRHLAGTDVAGHQAYLDAVVDYHRGLQAFFYPFFFHDRIFSREELAQIPRFSMLPQPEFFDVATVMPLIGVMLLLVLWLGFDARRAGTGRAAAQRADRLIE